MECEPERRAGRNPTRNLRGDPHESVAPSPRPPRVLVTCACSIGRKRDGCAIRWTCIAACLPSPAGSSAASSSPTRLSEPGVVQVCRSLPLLRRLRVRRWVRWRCVHGPDVDATLESRAGGITRRWCDRDGCAWQRPWAEQGARHRRRGECHGRVGARRSADIAGAASARTCQVRA